MKGLFVFLVFFFIHSMFAIPLQNRKTPLTPEKEVLHLNGQSQGLDELSSQFEGDIILNQEQHDYIFLGKNRNGMIEANYRWPNNTLPYKLNPNHTAEQNDYIKKALDKLESVSCLKFVPYTNQTDYIQLETDGGGCWSSVGRQGGRQIVNLKPGSVETGCFRLGAIMHEFLHAIGFFHMQSASDRDDYVKVEWKNMIRGTENNFLKYNTSFISNFHERYDYDSIMHYDAYGFTKNGYATIVPNDIRYIKTMGIILKLSPSDISKLNTMYNCKKGR